MIITTITITITKKKNETSLVFFFSKTNSHFDICSFSKFTATSSPPPNSFSLLYKPSNVYSTYTFSVFFLDIPICDPKPGHVLGLPRKRKTTVRKYSEKNVDANRSLQPPSDARIRRTSRISNLCQDLHHKFGRVHPTHNFIASGIRCFDIFG
jgi:hypothetical protein